ncbi:MAG TPA: hypothetical protein ENI13_01085, partial [candidate division CPR3 bacterium]|nr:hypothetical protein [candidate division CPR3 bacterium]
MKTKRGIWNFVDLPHIPKISRAQRRYWKDYLSKVLKLGIEVEFNLPEHKENRCPGSLDAVCLCRELANCRKDDMCAMSPACNGSPYFGTKACGLPKEFICAKHKNGKCINDTIEECPTNKCEHFEFECLKGNCLNFIPNCWNCRYIDQEQCRDCPEMTSDTKDPENIRMRIRDKLKPTGRVDMAGKSGISEVTTDGSLRGGGVE